MMVSGRVVPQGVASFLIAVDDFAFCAGAGAVIVHNVVFEIVEFAFLFRDK